MPKIPDVATKANEESAASFVSYYFDAINYAVESNDSTPLKKATGRECQVCGETLIDPADRAKKNRTWRVGGAHHAKIIDSYISSKNRAVVTVSFTSDSGYLCNKARENPEPFIAVETTIASIGLEYNKDWKVYTALFGSG